MYISSRLARGMGSLGQACVVGGIDPETGDTIAYCPPAPACFTGQGPLQPGQVYCESGTTSLPGLPPLGPPGAGTFAGWIAQNKGIVYGVGGLLGALVLIKAVSRR